jgi:hypothetical protein
MCHGDNNLDRCSVLLMFFIHRMVCVTVLSRYLVMCVTVLSRYRVIRVTVLSRYRVMCVTVLSRYRVMCVTVLSRYRVVCYCSVEISCGVLLFCRDTDITEVDILLSVATDNTL